MLRITAWLSIALLSVAFCDAQRIYKHGYLLLSEHDTLRGYISFYTQTPKEVSYKSFPGEKAETWEADNLFGFVTEEDSMRYVSAQVSFCTFTADRSGQALKHYGAKYLRTFLQELVAGPRLSLYKLTGYNEYYVRSTGQYDQLCYVFMSEDDVMREMGVVLAMPDDNIGDWYIYDYKNVLAKYISVEDTLRPYLEQMPFTEEAMRRIVTLINGGVVQNYVESPAAPRRITFFTGVSSVLADVYVPADDFIPDMGRHSMIMPCYTAGVRWRERDRNGPFASSLSLGYAGVSSSYSGRKDSLTNIYFSYRLQVLMGRFAIDYRVIDLGSKSGLSVGLFIGAHLSWLDASRLNAKTPTQSNFTLPGTHSGTDGMEYGLHLQCLLNRWEISGFLQLIRDYEEATDQGSTYTTRFYNTGVGVFYHF